MNNERGSTRTDTVLKMLLIAFISLLAFSSGVFFGKKLSDSDQQLKALESDFNSSHAAKTAENEESPSESELNPDEVNALSEKLVSSEKSEMNGEEEKDSHGTTHQAEGRSVASTTDAHHEDETHGAKTDAHHGEKADAHHEAKADSHNADKEEAHAVKTAAASHGHESPATAPAGAKVATTLPAHHSAKPDLSAASSAAARVAHNAAPSEPAHANEKNRVPNSLPKTVGTTHDVEFTVQVASYPTMEAAKSHAEELVKKGFPAFPVEASVGGKVWFRVSVGSFKTQREATTYRAQLINQTSVPSAIVQKIQR